MNTKILAIILAVLGIVLGVALVATKKQASADNQASADRILDLSNKWDSATGKFNEQVQVNVLLTNDLDARKKDLITLSNKISSLNATIARDQANQAKTDELLKAEQAEVSKRDAQIADLESKNHDLDQLAAELRQAITNLTMQIDDTKNKLAASEGNRAFLEKELQRLITEKADLERRFNDLTVLKAQIAKLRDQRDISRRLDWMREGVFAARDRKGAQGLIQSGPAAPAPPQVPEPAPHYDLNVEVGTDGSVHVIPPLTNAPASKP